MSNNHGQVFGPLPKSGSTPIGDPGYNQQQNPNAPVGYENGADGKVYKAGDQTGGVDQYKYNQDGDATGVRTVPVYTPPNWNGAAPGAAGGAAPGGAAGGGVAGGQQTLQAGGFANPDIQQNQWSLSSAFDDPNAANIYNVVNNGINNRANLAAPQASGVAGPSAANLGPIAASQASQLAPLMMLNGGAQLNQAQDQQYAGAQAQLINQLNGQANGTGPSVAAMQAKLSAQDNIRQQAALLGGQRGGSAGGLGQRGAMMAAASGNQAAAQTGALGRSQEALAAQSTLTGALSGARTQGQAQSTAQAGLDQAAALANQANSLSAAGTNASLAQQATLGNATNYNQAAQQQAQLQQQASLQGSSQSQQTNLANLSAVQNTDQLDNQTYQAMLSAYMAQNSQDMSASAAAQQLIANEQMSKYGTDAGVSINNSNNMMGLVGAGAQAAGTIGGALMAASDRKLKTQIKPVSARSLLNLIALVGSREMVGAHV